MTILNIINPTNDTIFPQKHKTTERQNRTIKHFECIKNFDFKSLKQATFASPTVSKKRNKTHETTTNRISAIIFFSSNTTKQDTEHLSLR